MLMLLLLLLLLLIVISDYLLYDNCPKLTYRFKTRSTYYPTSHNLQARNYLFSSCNTQFATQKQPDTIHGVHAI